MTEEEKKAKVILDERIWNLLDVVCGNCIIEDDERDEYQKSIEICSELIEKMEKELEETEREKNNFHNLYVDRHIKVSLLEKEINDLKEAIKHKWFNIVDRLTKISSKNVMPKSKIEELINQLEQDDKNITKKYKEGKGINCYLSDVDRVRIRAYRTKTREIKERLEKLLESEE